MKLFILAAGKGSRLFPMTKSTPKSLLSLGDGTTLLDRQITNAIHASEIDEVVIVTGYRADQIDKCVSKYRTEISVKTIFNPFYDISNNLLSLWCVNHLMLDKDFIITNGDNIYKNNVYVDILNTDRESTIQLTINNKSEYDDDDMKVLLSENKKILRVHKEIESTKAEAESVGLVLVRGENSRARFVQELLLLSKDPNYRNRYWLEIFNSLIASKVEIDSVYIDENDWREMDFHPDIERIKKEIIGKKFENFLSKD